jgi:glycosyltransferase involved in cell wall biosynthesis
MAAVVDLMDRLSEKHAITVIALHHPARHSPYRIGAVTVVPLGMPPGRGGPGRAMTLARGLAEVVRRGRRQDAAVVHALWADEPGAVAVLAAPLLRAGALVSVLGGELAALPDIGYGAALGRGGRWTVGLALRRADVVTVGSRYLARRVRASGSRRAPLLAPLGVDTNEFAPDHGSPADDRAVLFVGALEPVKDPAAAVRVFGQVARRDARARLVLCGEGSLRPQLERQIETLGLGQRVELRGHVPRAALASTYRRAVALIVTSRHEGQHVAAIEAAASGVAVVGFGVGALPDLSGGALIVPPGDEEALAEALSRLLDDDAMARHLGDSGRAAAVAGYDVAGTAERFEEIYARLALARRAWPASIE